jgi:hypothetical protein
MLKSGVDTWLRIMADTVKSLFGQVLVVFACSGKADGILPSFTPLIGQDRRLFDKNVSRPKADDTFSSPV